MSGADHESAAQKFLSDFLRALAHDLRAPLMRLRFSVELARTPDDADKQLDRADREISRMDQLLDEAQCYARLAEQMRDEACVRVGVQELLESALHDVMPEAARRGIQIVCNDGPACTLNVRAQCFRTALVYTLRQALSAVSGGQSLWMQWLAQDRESVAICLTDHGGAISPEHLMAWFAPMHHDPRQHEQLSLGLGNAMLEQVVLGHAGRILAQATEDGVETIMVLPLAPA